MLAGIDDCKKKCKRENDYGDFHDDKFCAVDNRRIAYKVMPGKIYRVGKFNYSETGYILLHFFKQVDHLVRLVSDCSANFPDEVVDLFKKPPNFLLLPLSYNQYLFL